MSLVQGQVASGAWPYPKERTTVSLWLWILIIIIAVLVVGYFARGRMSR